MRFEFSYMASILFHIVLTALFVFVLNKLDFWQSRGILSVIFGLTGIILYFTLPISVLWSCLVHILMISSFLFLDVRSNDIKTKILLSGLLFLYNFISIMCIARYFIIFKIIKTDIAIFFLLRQQMMALISSLLITAAVLFAKRVLFVRWNGSIQ